MKKRGKDRSNGSSDWRLDEASDEEFQQGFAEFWARVQVNKAVALVGREQERVQRQDEESLWNAAREALFRDEDVKPLARLLRGSEDIPPFIRQMMADLLEPERTHALIESASKTVIDAEAESRLMKDSERSKERDVDRLLFVRTPRTRRKMKTRARNLAMAVAVLTKEDAGISREQAVKETLAAAKRVEHERWFIDMAIGEMRAIKDGDPALYEFYRSTLPKL